MCHLQDGETQEKAKTKGIEYDKMVLLIRDNARCDYHDEKGEA
jgi:hypothetical protein